MKKRNRKNGSRKSNLRKISHRLARPMRNLLLAAAMLFPPAAANADPNLTIFWTGNVSGTWDDVTSNWADGTPFGAPIAFLTGDTVYFDTVSDTVTTAGATMTASSVFVVDSTLTLTGNIIADAASIDPGTNPADVSATGKLIVADSILTLNGENEFLGGILLIDSTLLLADDLALGEFLENVTTPIDSQGQILVGGDSVVKITEDRTISNRFVIGADVSTLTFDLAADTTLTIRDVDISDGNGVLSNTYSGQRIVVSGTTDNPKGHLVFEGNSTVNGGAIYNVSYDAADAVLDLAGLQSLTFIDNYSTARGGAIFSNSTNDSIVTLGNNITFQDNEARSAGGGISSVAANHSVITLGNTILFSGNSSRNFGGGIHSASDLQDSHVVLGSYVTFIDNSANSLGGAIFSGADTGSATITIGKKSLFENNTATYRGGALVATSLDSQITLSNYTTFTGNKTTSGGTNYGGGAVYSSQSLTVLGDTLFEYNLSAANGGAIYMAGLSEGTLLLDTNLYKSDGTFKNPGQIVFNGNLSFYGSAGETANAIHLDKNTTLSVTGSGNVYFNDSISSGTGGGNRYEQDGGMVQFKGDSVLNDSSAAGGGVDITGGTFRVVTGASFTTGGSDGEKFNVGSATLAGGGTVTSSNGFYFNGAVIAPDTDTLKTPNYSNLTFGTAITTIHDDNKIGALTLNGDVLLNNTMLALDLGAASTGDIIYVDGNVTFGAEKNTVNITTWVLGEHVILEADNIAAITDHFNSVLADGNPLGSNLSATLVLSDDGTQLLLYTANVTGNNILTWTGADDALWNTTSSDWKSGLLTPLYNAGDYVIFDSSDITGNRDITVQGAGVQVAGMDISGDGDYTFSGGGILVTKQGSTLTGTATGKLAMAGTGTLTLDNANRFVHGVTLSAGTIVLGDNAALGTYVADTVTPADSEGQVTVTANATVGINDDLTISNRFVVNAGQKLTLDTAGNTLTIQNVADGAFQVNAGATLELGDLLTLNNAAVSAAAGSAATFGANTRIQNTLGSAVVSAGTVNVYGESSFHVTGGSAVSMTGGSLNLDTDAGHIAFTAGGISLSGSSVNVTGGNTVYFDTAITGTSGSYTQTDGTSQFTGTNVLNDDANAGGEVSVSGSDTVFRVVSGATFATAGTDGKQFNVTGGATLAGGGTITSGNGFVFSGATISADSDRLATPAYDTATNTFAIAAAADPLNGIGTLTLVGDVVLSSTTLAVDLGTGVSDKIAVQSGSVTFADVLNLVDILTWTEGEYVIMETVTGGSSIENLTGDINDMFADILANGGQLGVNQNAYLELRDGTKLVLVTENLGDSIVLTWTGNDTGVWNTIDDNWKDASNAAATFSIGDYVRFDSTDTAGNRVITISGTQAQVAGMTVTGSGDYTFSGGGILATADGTDYTGADLGKLVKSGTGTLTLDNANEFTNGVTLSGGTIVLGNDAALGTYAADTLTPENSAGQITVNGNGGTVKILADRAISNRFVIDDNTALTVDTGTGGAILTIQNVDSGTVDGGAFALGVGSTLTLGDRVILTGNTAAAGSAVFGDTDSVITFGTNTYIHGNTGDAVVSLSNVYVYGNTNFADNTGYAINLTGGTLAIDTTAGHVAFTDNTAGSVYLDGAAMNIIGGNSVYFDDAISGTTATITQDGGLVQLKGDSAFTDADAEVSGDGTFRVVSGASLDLGTGTFTADNGTLAGGGSIAADSFSFDGAVISPDADTLATPTFNTTTLAFDTASTAIADANKIGTLALDGDAYFNDTTLAIDLGNSGAGDKITVSGTVTFGPDVNRVDYGTVTQLGTWDILTAGSDMTGVNFEAITGTFGGYSLTRGSGVRLKTGDATVLQLVLDNTKNLDLTWTGDLTDVWSTSDADLNWTDNPGGAPNETRFLTGDTVFFNAIGGGGAVTVVAGGVSAAAMTVGDAVDYIFNGGGITTTGVLTKTGTGTLTLNNANSFGGGTVLNGGRINIGNNLALGTQAVAMAQDTTLGFTGDHTIANSITLGGTDITLDTGANDAGITGIISGTGFTKTGTGTLTLSGTNTYTDGTALSGGRINVGNNAALGTGTVTMAYGTTLGFTGDYAIGNAIYLDGNATIDTVANTAGISGVISGAGFTKTSTGSLALSGDNIFTGGLTVNAGEIRVGHDNALGTGTVTLATGTTLAFDDDYSIANAVSLGGAGISVDTGAYSAELTGNLSGAGGFAKDGDGTLTVSGTNTHTGATDVNAGTLSVTAADGLATSSAVAVKDGATLTAADSQTFKSLTTESGAAVSMTGTDRDLTLESGKLEGTLTGVNDLTKTTGGKLEIDTAVSIDGDLSLSSGELVLSDDHTLTVGGTTTIEAGTTLSLNTLLTGGTLHTGDMTIDSGATLDIRAYSSSETVTLITSGSAIVGDFTTIMIAGTLYDPGDTSVSLEKFLNNVTVQKTLDEKAIEISNGGLVWNNTAAGTAHGVFYIASGNYTLGENLADNGVSAAWYDDGVYDWDGKTLDKTGAGRLVLTGTNTFTGAANVEAGTLAITKEAALGGILDGVNLSDGTVFELAYDADGTFGKTVSGTGSLLKTGTTTVTLTVAQQHTGATNVNGGTLALTVADALAGSSAVNVAGGATLSATADQAFKGIDVTTGATLAMGGNDLTLESGTITGTLDGVNNLTKTTDGVLEIDTTATLGGNLNLTGGELVLGSNNTLTVGGTTTIGDGTTLSIDSVLAGGTLHSGAMTIGDDTTLDIRTYAGSGTVTLITSDTAIDGNFATIYVGGVEYEAGDLTISLDKFINEMIVQKTTDLKAIEISSGGLVWNNTADNSAHGVFNVASGDVELGDDLNDNTVTDAHYEEGDYAWDGKTLDKRGDGRLLLSGDNGFTGAANVEGGTLAISHAGALAGTSGVNLADDTTFELAYNADGTFGKVVSGTGDLLKTGGSTVELTKAQAYTGATNVDGGTLALADDGDISASSGLNLAAGTAFDISGITAEKTGVQNLTGSGGVTLGSKTLELAAGDYEGVISGTGGIVKTGDETLVLRDVNTYTGTTSVTGGTLQLAVADAIAASGEVLLSGGTILADADQTFKRLTTAAGTTVNMGGNALTVGAGTLSGTMQNISTFTKDTAGDLSLSAANVLQNVATVKLEDGTTTATAAQAFQELLLEDDATLDMSGKALTVASGTLSGTLTDLGVFTKTGTDTLTLDGADMLASASHVYLSGGTLAATDDQTVKNLTLQSGTIFDLAGNELTIAATGRLTGSGTIKGDVTLLANTSISTGATNTANTLSIQGDLSFAANSTYQVEVNPAGGAADVIAVTGTAYLNGANVVHVGFDGTSNDYPTVGTWTILTANSIVGTFSGVTSNFAFLDAELYHYATSVQLELKRNAIEFDDYADTPNRHAVAGGLDSLNQGGQLYNQMMQLDRNQDIGGIYDQLSGEIHASLAGAMLDADRAFGRTLRQRIWLSNLVRPGYPLWFTADGFSSQADGNWNAAKAKHSGFGINIGAEKVVENWMAGIVFRYADSDLKVNRRASSSEIDSYLLGLYGAGQIGFFQLSVGGTYGWHGIDSTRQITNATLSQRLVGDYDAQTGQVFAELAFKCYGYGNASLMPYFGFSWNSVRTDGFTERGGSAALTVAKTTNDNVNTTLGIRASYLMFGRFALEGDLYWLHNYGDVDPTAQVAFSGGRNFTVLGSAFSRDAAGLTLSGNFIVTQRFNVRAGYNGLFSADTSAHTGSLTAEVKF